MNLELLVLKAQYFGAGFVMGVFALFIGKIVLLDMKMELEKLVRKETKRAMKQRELEK